MSSEYGYLSKNTVNDSLMGVPFIEVDQFYIKNSDKPLIRMDGIYFPVRYGSQHGNMIFDYIGTYLKLKTIYPEIKIIFFKSKFKDEFENFSLDFIKFYNSDVLNITEDNYIFEKILLGPNEWSPIDIEKHRKMFTTEYDEMDLRSKTWRLECTKAFISEFRDTINNNSKKEKIYITRKLFNNNYININDFWSQYRKHDNFYDKPTEDIFNTNGYKVIEFTGMKFFEQAIYGKNASIFSTIEGGSLWNAIWCDPNTPILSLRVNKKYAEYDYYWKDTLAIAGNYNFINLNLLDLSHEDANKKIKDCIKTLSNN